MNLLIDIRNFFVRERKWSLFFLLVLGIYVSLFLWRSKTVEKPSPQALEKLRLAETRLKEDIRSAGGIEPFLEKRPELFLAFKLSTFFLLAVFLVGLGIDFVWFAQPRRRRRLEGTSGPPEARHWNLGTVFKIILLFIVASLGLSLFLALLKAVLFRGTSPNFFLLLHTTILDLLCIGLVMGFVRRLGGRWQDLGFRGIRLWKDFWVGLTAYVAILPLFILVLVGLIIGAAFFSYEPPPHPLVEIFLEEERAPGLIAYSVFLACVAGPFFEEIFFRGFCYPAFKKKWGKGWALVLSSAFFGLIHQNTFAFLPIFVLGLGLAYLYEKRGNLIPSIVLHIVHNSVFIAYFFLAKQALTAGS